MASRRLRAWLWRRGQLIGDHARIGRGQRPHVELHDLAGRGWVRDVEVAGEAAARRLVGAFVDEVERRPDREPAEIDDDVGALSWRDQQSVELDRRWQESSLGSDLPEGEATDAGRAARASVTSFMIRNRPLQPFRMRNR